MVFIIIVIVILIFEKTTQIKVESQMKLPHPPDLLPVKRVDSIVIQPLLESQSLGIQELQTVMVENRVRKVKKERKADR